MIDLPPERAIDFTGMRMLSGGWVTLRDVYHCAIDKGRFHLYRVTQVELAASVITAIHQPPASGSTSAH